MSDTTGICGDGQAKQLSIEVKGVTLNELSAALDSSGSMTNAVMLRPGIIRVFRGAGLSVVIASITAVSGALGCLLTGVFALRKSKRVYIQDGDTCIEAPMEILNEKNSDQLKGLLSDIRSMKRPVIVVVKE